MRSSKRTDAARQAELAARSPGSYVIRAQAVQEVRAQLAAFDPVELPARDSMFSVVVSGEEIGLWSGASEPLELLRIPWDTVGVFSLHSYVDFPIFDLLSIYEGHVTTVIVVPVGDRVLELALWGDELLDQTASLLDEYGLRTVLGRIERLRPGYVEPATVATRTDSGGRRIPSAPVGIPSVAVEVTRYPRFTLRRRR